MWQMLLDFRWFTFHEIWKIHIGRTLRTFVRKSARNIFHIDICDYLRSHFIPLGMLLCIFCTSTLLNTFLHIQVCQLLWHVGLAKYWIAIMITRSPMFANFHYCDHNKDDDVDNDDHHEDKLGRSPVLFCSVILKILCTEL